MATNSRIRVFGPYLGGVLHYRHLAALFLVAWTVGASVFWLAHHDQVWIRGWILFWGIGYLALWGSVIALAPMLIVWVVMPIVVATAGRGAEGYIRYPAEDRLRWTVLLLLTCVASAITAVVAPAATIMLYRSSLRVVIIWAGGALATVAGLNLLYRLLRVVFRVEKREGRDVHRVPDDLRPLNTRVINLDVGALAPTLEVVDRGLRVWTRVVAGSAPTSKRVWQAITDERETLPSLWQRNLRGLTWRTVEGFRSAVGELVGVAPRSVVFLTSTTRALDAVLETVPSYDRIVTTNCEHSSEVLLFQSQGQRRGVEIRKVDLLGLLAHGAVFESFVQQMVAACSECQRPLVVVSEVPYCFGVRLPIAELAHALREEVPSAMLVVDGAHTVGQCPVNLEQCDFDYYVFGGHKWLFGPPSLGILVLGRAPSRDQQLIESLRGECFESLAFEGSRLGEAGATIALEPFVGLAEFLGRLLASRSEIFQNIRAIRSLFEVRIQESRHVRVLKYDNVPADRIAPGIVNLQGRSGDLGLASLGTVRDTLEDKDRVVTKLIEGPPSVRVCLPFYLTIGEVERAVEALDEAFASVGS